MSRYNKPRKVVVVEHPEQMRFLSELKNSYERKEIVLSKRQMYVVETVLRKQTYHDNHKYHLNVLRDKFYYIMDKID